MKNQFKLVLFSIIIFLKFYLVQFVFSQDCAKLINQQKKKRSIKSFNEEIHLNLVNNDRKIHPHNNRKYYWFENGNINFTQGDFSGKLLNGEYLVYYKNGELKEKGNFKFGVKEGIWKDWFLNGYLHSISFYKWGLKYGKWEEFDSTGKLSLKGNCKNNLKHGKWIEYNNLKNNYEIKKYKKGQLIENNRSIENKRIEIKEKKYTPSEPKKKEKVITRL